MYQIITQPEEKTNTETTDYLRIVEHTKGHLQYVQLKVNTIHTTTMFSNYFAVAESGCYVQFGTKLGLHRHCL